MSKIEQRQPIQVDRFDLISIAPTATEKKMRRAFAGSEKLQTLITAEKEGSRFIVQLNPEAVKFLQQNVLQTNKITIADQDVNRVISWKLESFNLELAPAQKDFLQHLIYAISRGQTPTQLQDVYPYTYQFIIENWSWLKKIAVPQ